MRQDYLIKAERVTKSFFEGFGGKLLFSRITKAKTYSSQDSKITCINYYVVFDNKDLFGRGDFSDEIYPKYRKMRSDWKCVLRKYGMKLYSDIAVGFVPLLSLKNKKYCSGYEYEKEIKDPLGVTILNINKIKSDYYRELTRKFKVKFALKEGGGMFIGPEGGMLYALEAANNILKKIDCFVDVGSGTGEMSAYVLKNCNPKKVVVNEASPGLKSHLKKYLRDTVKTSKTEVVFDLDDCRKMKFPKKADLISVGVFYGIQPSFIKNKVYEITKSLGAQGLLIIQSSMPETLFNQHILMGDEEGINKWPWYSKKFILSSYFSCVKVIFIDNQFITLASQSHDLISEIVGNLRGKIISYDDFLNIDFLVQSPSSISCKKSNLGA